MIANIITSIRIILVLIMSCLLIIEQTELKKNLFILFFIIATITDFLDGYFARKYKKNTFFGKIFDPISDKLLVIVAIFYLYQGYIKGIISDKISLSIEMQLQYLNSILIMSIFIIMRDFLVTGIRLLVTQKYKQNLIISPSWLGKFKTSITFIIILYLLCCDDTSLEQTTILFSIIAILNLISGVDYFIKHFNIIRNDF